MKTLWQLRPPYSSFLFKHCFVSLLSPQALRIQAGETQGSGAIRGLGAVSPHCFCPSEFLPSCREMQQQQRQLNQGRWGLCVRSLLTAFLCTSLSQIFSGWLFRAWTPECGELGALQLCCMGQETGGSPLYSLNCKTGMLGTYPCTQGSSQNI